MNIRLSVITALTIGALALTACGRKASTQDPALNPTATPAMAKEADGAMTKDAGEAMATGPMTDSLAMEKDGGEAMATERTSSASAWTST
jgi:hypothetical protein